MKKCFFFLLTMISFSVAAQTNDPVIMTINGHNIKKSEFEYIYNKNNNEESIEKKSLEDYAELFKNFKLKVEEAEAQRLDTLPDFVRELADYRVQLAKPYLDSLETDINFEKKEYDRMKFLVEVSHILIPFPGVPENKFRVLPADTLEAYKKIMLVYNRIRKGESFDKMVQEYTADEQSKGRNGYLGWFSGLQLNLPLEDVVYSLPVGQMGIARSNYGYHILKLLNKRDNPGQMRASHILITIPENADEAQVAAAQSKIDSIYNALLNGADFATLAKEDSGDPASAAKGGDLGWFGYGSMIKEFRDNIFALKEEGDLTKPFRTPFGFHVAKLTGKKPLESFEEKKDEIQGLLKKGGYTAALYKPAMDRLEKEYGFSKDDQAYKDLINQAAILYPTDSLFEAAFSNKDVLFKVNNGIYTTNDFINFLKKDPYSPYKVSTEFVTDRLKAFEYIVLVNTLGNDLENRYPEFKNLVREFSDGSLMFEVSKREVWDKASLDTDGLQKFFNDNKQRYAWDEPRYKGYVILAKDAATKKKMQKEISKMNPDEAVTYLDENYRVGDVSYVKIEKGGLFKKGENPFVDEQAFKTGKAKMPEGFGDFFLLGKVLNAPESFMDVRGAVVTDYQDYLEKEWIKKLNQKYPVTIYKDVLFTIK